ncbi:MAG: peptidase protein [Parcubacteria group bacterium]|nr:peptidase protein [Parcubacteria group bacterium]
MQYKKTTLPNGVRIITVPMKGSPAVTVLVMTETGSNYEEKRENGLSHFLEHMVFKGTPKRPTSAIVHRDLDSLGAQSNAFTNTEFTGYYVKGAKHTWKKSLDILSDLYLNPILPEADLENERGVILQEISMYEDLPQMHVWDILGELMYGDTPAGRSIAGTRENVKNFSQKDFMEYRNKHYTAGKTIVIIAGDVEAGDVKKEAEKYFKSMVKGKSLGKDRVKEVQKAPAYKVLEKKTDQMHLAFGFRSYGARDKRGPALTMLAVILGSGFSSRLFEKLRDQMGVCYYVRAQSDRSTDHGVFAISTGIDPKRYEEVIKAILDECTRLKEELVSEEEMKRMKDYVIGNMYLGLETSDALAEFAGFQEIIEGEIKSPKEREKALRAVTARDIQKIAREIFTNDRLNLAIVGDISDSKPLKKVLIFK